MLAYTPADSNSFETMAKTFIIPARQNQFLQENIFNIAPVRRIAIAMNTNSASTGFYTKIPLWYQQFNFGPIKILRGGLPIVEIDADDNCCLYVTTMKAMNFQEDIPSIPSIPRIPSFFDNFKDHYVPVFDLTSMQVASEFFHYPELVGELLRLELKFTFLLEHVTEINCIGGT